MSSKKRTFLGLLLSIFMVIQAKAGDTTLNPLAVYSRLWNAKKFQDCHTAKSSAYLTEEEKSVIWILNQIKLDPKLFLQTVLLNPRMSGELSDEIKKTYYRSLLNDFRKMKPCQVLLMPDSLAFESARCHAIQAGARGHVGHNRFDSGCPFNCKAECCDYGKTTAFEIIMHLLIDDGVPSLGHRKICLSAEYSALGVSIQPHITYIKNAVLDFR